MAGTIVRPPSEKRAAKALEDDRIPASATGVIAVDLDALASNWRALAKLVSPAECAAVVKANAYGLGAARVIPALRRAGCRTFFIATADEGAAARALAPDATIYALDGMTPGSADAFLNFKIIPVLGSIAELREAVASLSGQSAFPVALHVDSGLNRLGLSLADVQDVNAVPSRLKGLDIKLVLSHLACADDPTHPKNEAQRKVFDQMRALLPAARASIAASDGLMLGRAYHYGLVRPGYALYGGQAFQGGRTPVEPVVSVHARILHVRDVAAGGTVGYGATWSAARASRIAIIAAGYADGIPRAATAQLPRNVYVNGAAAPVVGRVSMDLIAIDVTGVTPVPQRGDLVELVGKHNPIETLGVQSGTIGYEILTSLSPRFHRTYIENAAHHG